MIHTPEQILKKTRCLVKKLLQLKSNKDIPDCHELDDIMQEATYLEYETRELEDKP